MQESKRWISWVILILQNCVLSLSFSLNWINILWKMVLLFMSHQVQDPFNDRKIYSWIISICEKIDTRAYHDLTIYESYFTEDSTFTTRN